MIMYSLYDINKEFPLGPAFWAKVNDIFPTHTPSSLYTKFREMGPKFKDLDRSENKTVKT